MNKLLSVALAATVAVIGVSSAQARDDHRRPGGHHGHHRPNGRPVVVAPGALVIGHYYGGHGYWDGRRYWGHRDRRHGGWRYR